MASNDRRGGGQTCCRRSDSAVVVLVTVEGTGLPKRGEKMTKESFKAKCVTNTTIDLKKTRNPLHPNPKTKKNTNLKYNPNHTTKIVPQPNHGPKSRSPIHYPSRPARSLKPTPCAGVARPLPVSFKLRAPPPPLCALRRGPKERAAPWDLLKGVTEASEQGPPPRDPHPQKNTHGGKTPG